MNDVNYIGLIVRILETPKQKISNENIILTQFRAQLPDVKQNNPRIVHLAFWGNLADDVKNYYKANDYIIIEGYISLRKKNIYNIAGQISNKIQITVLKIYPFLLNSNRFAKKS